jgi:hypothetical protein
MPTRLAPALTELSGTSAAVAAGSISGAHRIAQSLGAGSSGLNDAANAAFCEAYRLAMAVPAALAVLTAALVRWVLRGESRAISKPS